MGQRVFRLDSFYYINLLSIFCLQGQKGEGGKDGKAGKDGAPGLPGPPGPPGFARGYDVRRGVEMVQSHSI